LKKKSSKVESAPPLALRGFRFSKEQLLLGGILAVAAFLRFWHIGWSLPELYEEAIAVRVSTQFWKFGASGIDLSPKFFTYPAFTFYLQFAAEGVWYWAGRIFGVYGSFDAFETANKADFTTFALIGRSISCLFDLGTVVTAYAIAKRLLSGNAGLLAALFVAVSTLHVKEAHLVNVDTPLTFLCLLTAYFSLRYFERPTLRFAILAGACMGLATATKYNGAVVGIAIAAAFLARLEKPADIGSFLRDKRFWAALACGAGVFIAFNPYIILEFDTFSHDLFGASTHMTTGHLGVDTRTITAWYYLFEVFPGAIGFPLTVFGVGSLLYLTLERKRKYFVVLAFPLVFFAILSSWAMRAERYALPLVPFLAICGGIAGVLLWERFILPAIQRAAGSRRVTGIAFIPGALILFAGVYTPVNADYAYHKAYTLPDTRTITKQWIEKNYPAGTAIATGPFGIEFAKTVFLTLPVPFNALQTEQQAPFFHRVWYENLDLFIASDYDYGRYAQDPARFSEFLQFYDSLESTDTLVFESKPSEFNSGPTLWVYKMRPLVQDTLIPEELLARVSEAPEAVTLQFVGKLGAILNAKGQSAKSEQLLKFVVQNFPDNLDGHEQLAMALLKEGKGDEALTQAETYNAVNDRNARMLMMAGGLFLQKKDLASAEKRFESAVAVNPNLGQAYVELAIIASARGDSKRVLDILNRYLKVLPPGSDQAEAVRQEIQSIGGK
jgi:4-amino-4-deoxy-L-arabinose transferase-like glycosyltransferase/tetratricopeptide (TPR) repeat protein